MPALEMSLPVDQLRWNRQPRGGSARHSSANQPVARTMRYVFSPSSGSARPPSRQVVSVWRRAPENQARRWLPPWSPAAVLPLSIFHLRLPLLLRRGLYRRHRLSPSRGGCSYDASPGAVPSAGETGTLLRRESASSGTGSETTDGFRRAALSPLPRRQDSRDCTWRLSASRSGNGVLCRPFSPAPVRSV